MTAKQPRMGGRAARQALRSAPIPADERPVQPGQSGGRFQPLSRSDVERIHHAALDALETIGLANPLPSQVELFTTAGCSMSEEGRLLFPRALVEDTVASAARNIVLHGQEERYDLELSGERVYFGTAGAAVHLVDIEKREYRDSTISDLYDAARLVDRMEHIHFFPAIDGAEGSPRPA